MILLSIFVLKPQKEKWGLCSNVPYLVWEDDKKTPEDVDEVQEQINWVPEKQ